MKRLAIIGSGDLGQLIAYHASNDNHYTIAGFFDDYQVKDNLICGYPILGNTEDVKLLYETGHFDFLIVAIGYKHFNYRKSIFESYADIIPFGKVIHSSSYIDSSCIIGKGVCILPGCVLDRNVIIEDNVLLNTGSCIAHDSMVKSHSFLSPGVCVAGFTQIGSCCNIGINSTIIDNIEIADNVQTGGGTVVISSIKNCGLYVGNPAKFLKQI
jgi:sugar O-acyltransferase (sialic acid O-acetyltransferase NeuD family)